MTIILQLNLGKIHPYRNSVKHPNYPTSWIYFVLNSLFTYTPTKLLRSRSRELIRQKSNVSGAWFVPTITTMRMLYRTARDGRMQGLVRMVSWSGIALLLVVEANVVAVGSAPAAESMCQLVCQDKDDDNPTTTMSFEYTIDVHNSSSSSNFRNNNNNKASLVLRNCLDVATLAVHQKEGSALCTTLQALATTEDCGCLVPSLSFNKTAKTTTRTTSLSRNDNKSPPQQRPEGQRLVVEAEESSWCSLCQDMGNPISFPTKNISVSILETMGLLQHLMDLGLPLTCEGVDDFLQSAQKNEITSPNKRCQEMQVQLGGICGCRPISGHCHFCSENEFNEEDEEDSFWGTKVFLPSALVLRGGGGDADQLLTCSEVKGILTQVPDSSSLCMVSQQFNYLCGCNDGNRIYFGADTELKQAMLVWLLRFSAILSLVSSLYVVVDVLGWRKRLICCGKLMTAGSTFSSSEKSFSVYRQLVLGLNVFDIFGSLAFIFSTAPIPQYDSNLGGAPTDIYEARGNQATCQTQGFFIHLGLMGSIFYNLMLSTFYVLVIVKNFREVQLQSLLKWFHAVPIGLALGLAFGGLPFYREILLCCHFAPPPLGNRMESDGLFILPVSIVLLGSIFNMGWIYWTVLKQSQIAQKWRLHSTAKHYEERQRNSAPPSSEMTIGPRINNPGKNRTTVFLHHHEASAANLPSRRLRIGRGGTERVILWQAVFYMISFLSMLPMYYVALIDGGMLSYGFWVSEAPRSSSRVLEGHRALHQSETTNTDRYLCVSKDVWKLTLGSCDCCRPVRFVTNAGDDCHCNAITRISEFSCIHATSLATTVGQSSPTKPVQSSRKSPPTICNADRCDGWRISNGGTRNHSSHIPRK